MPPGSPPNRIRRRYRSGVPLATSPRRVPSRIDAGDWRSRGTGDTQMSYDPTGPYAPDPNYQQQAWQQPTEPQHGGPSPGPSYPPPPPQPGYPTSGRGDPPSGAPPAGHPQTGDLPAPPAGPEQND